MQRMKDSAPTPPDATWFKRLVAKAIVYRAAEKKVRAMKFPAYGAQITAYVVSGLAQKTGGRIDFEGVWSRQSVSAELESLVETWAPQIDTLLRQSAGQKNPSEWFKREECWMDIVNRLPALSDPLPPELSYAGAADIDEVATAQPRAHSVADYDRLMSRHAIKNIAAQVPVEIGFQCSECPGNLTRGCGKRRLKFIIFKEHVGIGLRLKNTLYRAACIEWVNMIGRRYRFRLHDEYKRKSVNLMRLCISVSQTVCRPHSEEIKQASIKDRADSRFQLTAVNDITRHTDRRDMDEGQLVPNLAGL